MSKKGFTLIELLAVIVILAVIALIATPIILGVIDNAREGALIRSADGLVDAAENYYTKILINEEEVDYPLVFTGLIIIMV